MNEMDKYLKCTEVIDYDSPAIKRKARALTKGLKTDKEKAIALFYFVRDNIKYNPYDSADRYEYSIASATLKRGYGLCFQKAAVLVAMCRVTGNPRPLRVRRHQEPHPVAAVPGHDVRQQHTGLPRFR